MIIVFIVLGIVDVASAWIQITADEIDDAYTKVLASDVRYRFVIDAATI